MPIDLHVRLPTLSVDGRMGKQILSWNSEVPFQKLRHMGTSLEPYREMVLNPNSIQAKWRLHLLPNWRHFLANS